jgi:hypothetical protein
MYSFRSEEILEGIVGKLSGEPPLRTVFHLDLIRMLRPLRVLRTLLYPDRLWILQMVFRPALRILLCPSI